MLKEQKEKGEIVMKKILIVIAIVVVIIAGVFVANKMLKNDETKPTSQSSVSNNTINNEIQNNNTNEANTNQNNAIQDNNTVADNNETEENETKPSKDPIAEAKTDEEKAIAIVKKEWGEDSSVNFVYDHKNENGEFVIAVRNSSTTAAIEWYIVNINTGTCKTR